MKRLIIVFIAYLPLTMAGPCMSRVAKNPNIRIDAILYKINTIKEEKIELIQLSHDRDDYYYSEDRYENMGQPASSYKEANRITLGRVDIKPIQQLAEIIYYVRIGHGQSVTEKKVTISLNQPVTQPYNDDMQVTISASIIKRNTPRHVQPLNDNDDAL